MDAITMWKHNLDKQFEGVEPCIICYSVRGNSSLQHAAKLHDKLMVCGARPRAGHRAQWGSPKAAMQNVQSALPLRLSVQVVPAVF